MSDTTYAYTYRSGLPLALARVASRQWPGVNGSKLRQGLVGAQS